MFNNSIFTLCEPLILYIILYFPSLFSSGKNTDIYSSFSLTAVYTVISLFQIFFLIYFMRLKKTDKNLNGLRKFSFRIIPVSLLYLIPVYIIILTIDLVFSFYKIPSNEINMPGNLLFFLIQAFIISLLTGYREEIFFRSYLISSAEPVYGKKAALFISSVLFSISHLQGGLQAILTAFAAGLFLSIIFLKHRNLHINALTHAFYNFSVLVFCFL